MEDPVGRSPATDEMFTTEPCVSRSAGNAAMVMVRRSPCTPQGGYPGEVAAGLWARSAESFRGVRDMPKMKTALRLAFRASCIGFIVAPVLMAAGPLRAGATQQARSPAAQPPPTPDPAAPGISIATANFDLPDPFVLTQNGTYYMYLSTPFGDYAQNVPVLTGRPGHWSQNPIDAVPDLPAWAIGNPAASGLTWSPEVHKFGDLYVMYFAPQLRSSVPTRHCIAIGTSPNPTGPFYVNPVPFICQLNLGGDIDPEVFVDPHGPDGPHQPDYLVWKSDNNSTPGDGVTTIWAQPLSNDGLSLEGRPVSIFAPDEPWQMPLVEAPQMTLSPSSAVWMFFSAGEGFYTPDYGIGAVRCAGPLGPCNDPLPAPLITSNAQGAGPGEETYFVGPDGSDWLLYSPIHTGVHFEVDRPVEAARVGWSSSGPYVAAAGRFPLPDPGRRSHSGKRRADAGWR